MFFLRPGGALPDVRHEPTTRRRSPPGSRCRRCARSAARAGWSRRVPPTVLPTWCSPSRRRPRAARAAEARRRLLAPAPARAGRCRRRGLAARAMAGSAAPAGGCRRRTGWPLVRAIVRLPVEGPAEVAELSEALNHLSDALATSEGRERAFLLSVSHELRTPLTAVRGYAEALSDGVVPSEDVSRTGATMLAESERLDRLVSDLLDLARLGRPGLQGRRGAHRPRPARGRGRRRVARPLRRGGRSPRARAPGPPARGPDRPGARAPDRRRARRERPARDARRGADRAGRARGGRWPRRRGA